MKILTYTKQVNPSVLLDEIREVLDIPTLFYHEDTHRIDIPVDDNVNKASVDPIVEAHDLNTAQKDLLIAAKATDAKVKVKGIPAWATMTEQEAITYIQTNVTDLASAKLVLIALARVIVHLRDAQWPDL